MEEKKPTDQMLGARWSRLRLEARKEDEVERDQIWEELVSRTANNPDTKEDTLRYMEIPNHSIGQKVKEEFSMAVDSKIDQMKKR